MTKNTESVSAELIAPPAAFMPLITEWFAANGRALPWRQGRDAYRIWVSEIMLQQTTIGAVTGYYERFIGKLPDIASLAACPDDELMKLWEGLGYYSRARNLKKAARAVIDRGGTELPADYDALLALPGIGPYTAGAIASMAFHLPCAAVDGNVLRVMTRLTGCFADVMKPATRAFYEKQLNTMMQSHPEIDPASLNEGLMELGEIVCLPHGGTKCGECPLKDICRAAADGLTETLPVRIQKTKRRIEQKTVLVIKAGERIALRLRPDEGLLAGLYEFPHVPGVLDEAGAVKAAGELLGADLRSADESGPEGVVSGAEGVTAVAVRPLGEARHLFSHIEWQMTGYEIKVESGDEAIIVSGEKRGLVFATRAEFAGAYAVPGAFKAFKKDI